MGKRLEEDFNYWVGMIGVGGEAVNRQDLKPFLTILKEKYLNALREVQKLAAEKSQLELRNAFLEGENEGLKDLNEELTQENNSLTEQIYG
jgi:FtsZ-binding cell division protein ZapB